MSLVQMGGTSDEIIWQYASTNDFTFLTQDKDFANLSLVWGSPPKVILLEIGNCTVARTEDVVRKNAIRLSEFDRDTKRSLLILR